MKNIINNHWQTVRTYLVVLQVHSSPIANEGACKGEVVYWACPVQGWSPWERQCEWRGGGARGKRGGSKSANEQSYTPELSPDGEERENGMGGGDVYRFSQPEEALMDKVRDGQGDGARRKRTAEIKRKISNNVNMSINQSLSSGAC